MAIKPRKESLEDKVKRLAAEKESAISGKKKKTWKDTVSMLSKYTPRKWLCSWIVNYRAAESPSAG
jgi:tight adherence protein B